MLTRIKRLPVDIANQIAAGEVIERPASVVKELIENAIDAEASQINLEIGFGGLNLIKVSDNGLGILSQDLPLAIAPHATSKIYQLTDLHAIQSMGFRGEALASIASISRLIIYSKSASEEQAMRFEAMSHALSSCARSQGTTIEVHDIFFNAPVRKKFLKSERAEFQAIEMMVKRIAMSAPKIAMSLSHNGQLQWQLSPAQCQSSMYTRMTKLLGKKFFNGAHYIEVVHAGMRLEGWLGGANYQRSQNDGLWIYLNHRMVKDKLLNHAVKQAYSSVLDPGRYPVCVLYLTVNPSEVDVNVHPTKHEVRFQQARLVHDFIVSQVSRVIEVPTKTMDRQLPELTHSLSFSRPPLEANDITQHDQACLGYVFSSDEVKKQMIELDTQFALFLIEHEVYLADLVALRSYWFLELVHRESIPWPNRPLLVPIYYSDLSYDFNEHQDDFLLLKQLGIELEILENSKLVVQTLPSRIPQLDIKSFLQDVFSRETPSLSECISILAAYFSANFQMISSGQQAVFRDFVFTQIQQVGDKADLGMVPNTIRKFVKKISPALCQELLYG